jgi:hypothetical protein
MVKKYIKYTIRFEDEYLRNELKKLANRDGTSSNKLIINILKNYVEREKMKDKTGLKKVTDYLDIRYKRIKIFWMILILYSILSTFLSRIFINIKDLLKDFSLLYGRLYLLFGFSFGIVYLIQIYYYLNKPEKLLDKIQLDFEDPIKEPLELIEKEYFIKNKCRNGVYYKVNYKKWNNIRNEYSEEEMNKDVEWEFDKDNVEQYITLYKYIFFIEDLKKD